MAATPMANHHHHHHHNMPMSHSIEDSNDTSSLFDSLPTTTAATILQAVMTTMMANDAHHHHHQMSSDLTSGDVPESTHIHSTHVGDGDHSMPMYFYFSVDSIILFSNWRTSTTAGLICSVIGICIMAMLYEGIKFFREYLFKKYFTSLEYSSVSVLGEDGKPVTEVHKVARNRMFSWPHAIQTILHVTQMVLSYFLMLIFMTYNIWLCLAVIVGAGIGYFLFGWRKATVVDITEHCH